MTISIYNFKICFQCVQIQLVMGHKATVRTKKTPEGFTHNWEVFIHGSQQTDIQHFVDKVVFYLHEDFQNPKRGKLLAQYNFHI